MYLVQSKLHSFDQMESDGVLKTTISSKLSLLAFHAWFRALRLYLHELVADMSKVESLVLVSDIYDGIHGVVWWLRLKNRNVNKW